MTACRRNLFFDEAAEYGRPKVIKALSSGDGVIIRGRIRRTIQEERFRLTLLGAGQGQVVRSDDDGFFSFSAVPAGTYRIERQGAGYAASVVEARSQIAELEF